MGCVDGERMWVGIVGGLEVAALWGGWATLGRTGREVRVLGVLLRGEDRYRVPSKEP